MVEVLDSDLEGSKFELQSLYYVHFRTHTFGKGMNSLLPSAMGEIVSLLFF